MKLLRRLLLATPVAVLLLESFLPGLALANAPAIQISPLQYEDILTDRIKTGHIDVANPTDAPVTIDAVVQGFKQEGTNGDLRFFDDPDLAAAIKVDLTSFQLQPRDAIRVLFSVDPAKLPPGGIYAAIFFRTRPTDKPGSSSYVTQSANIGTLLILRHGGTGAPVGGLSGLSVPFWQFGDGLHGFASVHNAGSPSGGVAFRPGLEAKVLPWGRRAKQATGLVLPGSSRQFEIVRPGSFAGLLPVTVTDTQTHTSRTVWALACTGWYAWLILVLLVAVACAGLVALARRLRRGGMFGPVPKLRIPKRAPARNTGTGANVAARMSANPVAARPTPVFAGPMAVPPVQDTPSSPASQPVAVPVVAPTSSAYQPNAISAPAPVTPEPAASVMAAKPPVKVKLAPSQAVPKPQPKPKPHRVTVASESAQPPAVPTYKVAVEPVPAPPPAAKPTPAKRPQKVKVEAAKPTARRSRAK